MTDENKDPDDVQVINPPNMIKTKVSGSGGPSPAMLERAEEAINRLSDDYPKWAMKDIDTLCALMDEAEETDEARIDNLRQIFKLAHDMRGQGGSFGYPLMTRVGSSLCRFTEVLNNPDERAMKVVRAHVEAMRAVITNRVKGDGDAIGREIAQGLEFAVDRFQSQNGN